MALPQRLARGAGPDVALMTALALGAGMASWQAARRIPPVVMQEARLDLWFQGDVPQVMESFSSAASPRHARTNRHPLFSLFLYPPVKLLRVLGGLEPAEAMRWCLAAAASLWAAMLFGLLRSLSCPRPDAALFTALAASSAAFLFWFAVPETWPFGSLTLLLALALVARSERRALPLSWYSVVSALTLSMTVTNWMGGLIAAFVRLPWRKALAVTAAALALVAALWTLQKRLFPAAQLASRPGYFAEHVFHPSSGGPRRIVEAFAVHSMVMPAITHKQRSVHSRLSVQDSRPGSGSPWGAVAAPVWILLLCLGAWALLTVEARRPLRLAIGLTLAGQFALHLVFGGQETFLFSLHWLPLLVLVAACSVLTRARPAALGLAAVLLVCATVNNGLQFTRAVQAAQALAEGG
jgi:hypothetical protein